MPRIIKNTSIPPEERWYLTPAKARWRHKGSCSKCGECCKNCQLGAFDPVTKECTLGENKPEYCKKWPMHPVEIRKFKDVCTIELEPPSSKKGA